MKSLDAFDLVMLLVEPRVMTVTRFLKHTRHVVKQRLIGLIDPVGSHSYPLSVPVLATCLPLAA